MSTAVWTGPQSQTDSSGRKVTLLTLHPARSVTNLDSYPPNSGLSSKSTWVSRMSSPFPTVRGELPGKGQVETLSWIQASLGSSCLASFVPTSSLSYPSTSPSWTPRMSHFVADWHADLPSEVGRAPREGTLSQGLARKGATCGQSWSLSHLEIPGVLSTFLALALSSSTSPGCWPQFHLDSDKQEQQGDSWEKLLCSSQGEGHS